MQLIVLACKFLCHIYISPLNIPIFQTWINEKKLMSKPADLTSTSSNDEAEQEKVMNLWEKTKPFFECKESLRKYISKRLEIQVPVLILTTCKLWTYSIQ